MNHFLTYPEVRIIPVVRHTLPERDPDRIVEMSAFRESSSGFRETDPVMRSSIGVFYENKPCKWWWPWISTASKRFLSGFNLAVRRFLGALALAQSLPECRAVDGMEK